MSSRAAIRRLRNGVVPSWEIERLSVGYGKIKQSVNDSFDRLMLGDRATPLFVRGEWGTGKTHFLSYLRAAAKSRGLPSAQVDLNARSAALNYPQRFYAAIAETLAEDEHRGLRDILIGMLRDERERERLANFALKAEAGDLRSPLIWLCCNVIVGDQLELMDDRSWSVIYGADLSWADYSYKRDQAIARIATLGRMFEATGRDGLVIVFDEAETIDQLWNIRSRLSAYSVLGELCQLPATWCVFGITERFDRTIDADLDRGSSLYESVSDSGKWFLRAWQRGDFEIIDPPTLDARSARTLAVEIVRLYGNAYEQMQVEDRLLDRSVEEWLRNPSRNPRRLVRTLIHRLDASRKIG